MSARTIISLQPNDFRIDEIFLESQNISDLGSAPTVDRLVVITDTAQPVTGRRQQPQPNVLSHVRVLVLVDQNVLELVPIMVQATIDPSTVFSGSIDNLDSIREYIKCLAPISTLVEKDYAEELAKTDDITTMQQFFYTFWSSRDRVNPKQAWEDYHKQVIVVNTSFKTLNLKGYESDRGVVYLKYGTPDRIVQSDNEPGAFPYEIWHYYTLGTQRNKKFVFMTHDIVTNDFKLIHSDAVGELNNFRWTTEIYQRTYGTYNDYGVDGAANPDSYGDRAKDYYDNPR